MTTVKQRFIHMTARKLRLVADSVRGKSTDAAIASLSIMPKASAKPVLHAVKSAVAASKASNANNLVITTIYVDEGPAIKRRILRSRGRASRMEHRFSHLTLTVDTAESKSPSKKSAKATEEKS